MIADQKKMRKKLLVLVRVLFPVLTMEQKTNCGKPEIGMPLSLPGLCLM